MRRARTFVVAVVSLLLVATMVLAAAGPNPGNGSTDIRVMNVSNTAASATVDYYNTSGGIEATRSTTIPANGSYDFAAADSGLGDGFNGTAVVSSDQQLASVAFINWTGGQSTDGTTAAAYSGVAEGATELYCPSLAARANKQKSILAVQNADSSTADVRLDFYDRDGNAWSGNPVTASLPVGAGKTWDLTDLSLPNTVPDGWLGSVKVSSPNGKKLAAVVTMFWKSYSSAYNCASQGTTTVIFPDIKRRKGTTLWKQYGGNVIQNLSSSSVANITVSVLDRNGTTLYSFNHQIQPLASQGFNTRFNANTPDPTAFFNAMGNDFVGALKVTSDQPLTAVYNGISLTGNQPRASTYSAGSPDSARTTIWFPGVYRLESGGSFTRFSALLVYNTGTTPANVTVTWYRKDGTQAHQFTSQIPAGTSHGYNTRYGANVPNKSQFYSDLGSNFAGGVKVESDVPVLGISNVNYPDQQATYNAYQP